MDSSIRLNRHAQLWEDGNNSVHRIAVSGLIFATVILLKVVMPYQNPTLQDQRKTLAGQEEAEQTLDENLKQVRSIEETMVDIEKVILNAPWDRANEDLKQFFRDGGGDDAKAEADKTVRKIATQIHDAVVIPLRTAIDNAEVKDELAAFPEKIAKEITAWENGKLNDHGWYKTTNRKDAAIEEVVDILRQLRNQASEVIKQKKAEVSDEATALEEKFTAAEKKVSESTKEINEAMNEALPSWAREMIPPKLMVTLYPFILAGIALFLVVRAVIASRHFHGMADEHGWTTEERREPLLSSYRTLTRRGTVGTTLTVVAYSAVLAGFWYCLYHSQKIAGLESASGLWGHGLMALLMITVWVAPWWRRPGPAT